MEIIYVIASPMIGGNSFFSIPLKKKINEIMIKTIETSIVTVFNPLVSSNIFSKYLDASPNKRRLGIEKTKPTNIKKVTIFKNGYSADVVGSNK